MKTLYIYFFLMFFNIVIIHCSPVAVVSGGTSVSSFTAYTVICGGTTNINPLQSIASVGTSTQILTSNGAGALPTFQDYLPMQTASVTLTSAQVKSLNATPITLIAAPGSGKIIFIVTVTGKLTYGGSNVFVAGAAQTISLAYNTSSGTAAVLTSALSNVALVASSTRLQRSLGSIPSSNNVYTTVENLPVVVCNPIATEISGNAANDNTVTVIAEYQIITI